MPEFFPSDQTLSKPSPSRRDFLIAATSSLGASALVGCATNPGAAPLVSPKSGGVILFQGDSITDAGRDRNSSEANSPKALGNGYPVLIASALLGKGQPWRFYNRGVSGNKVPQLQDRWDADALALKPDILSILIGVNDYWHARDGHYSGTAADYEAQFTKLLADTRRALPNIRFVVLEPFVARFGAVDATWFPAFDERRAIAARVAHNAGATFVPLQNVFDRLAAQTKPSDWIGDGVHPTLAGHSVIAEQWRVATGL